MASRGEFLFESVSPILTVRDVPEALEFYAGRLGFEVAWTSGDPPTYASVCRDRVELNLGLPAAVRAAGPSAAYIVVTDVDAYYAHVLAHAVPLKVEIGDRAYGMRDFAVLDPSGNDLSFGQAIAG